VPRSITVAALQLGPAPEDDKPAVGARMLRLLDRAIARSVTLAAFPELCLTPYFCVRAPAGDARDDRYFDTWPPPAARALLETAARHGVAVVLPFAELDGHRRRYNSAAMVDRTGRLAALYRKVHVPHPVEFEPGRFNQFESEWFRPGDLAFPVCDLGPARVGTQICYDRHFPESTRALALGGAEVVALGSNSPTYQAAWRRDTWDVICRMRAYENVLFLIAAGKAGREGDVDYVGRSCIVSPVGEILAQAGSLDDEVVVATIDLDRIAAERQRRRYLAELRPDQYGTAAREPAVAT
jgi:predicted amidohydrolase